MLKSPTLAEQALAFFKASNKDKKTAVLTAVAQFGGELEVPKGKVAVYTFDDDSSLRVSGRGASHRMEAVLP